MGPEARPKWESRRAKGRSSAPEYKQYFREVSMVLELILNLDAKTSDIMGRYVLTDEITGTFN